MGTAPSVNNADMVDVTHFKLLVLAVTVNVKGARPMLRWYPSDIVLATRACKDKMESLQGTRLRSHMSKGLDGLTSSGANGSCSTCT